MKVKGKLAVGDVLARKMHPKPLPTPVYWTGTLPPEDDFGEPYGMLMYDAPTVYRGKWANMSHKSWLRYGATDQLGTGLGQKYEKQPDGRWLKVEG